MCEKPAVALIPLLDAGLITRKDLYEASVNGTEPPMSDNARQMYNGYFAPLKNLPDEAYNGYRRFPLSIPIYSYHNGNSAAQAMHYQMLLTWDKKVDFIWGLEDEIFTESLGRKWCKQMNGSFTPVAGAGHFLQNTHAREIVNHILRCA